MKDKIDLISYSFKKKEKIAIIRNLLNQTNNSLCFELGCAKGIITSVLKDLNKKVFSADIDWENVIATKELINDNVILVKPFELPFKNNTFEIIICIDFLEHIDKDIECLKELSRIIKHNGKLIIATPLIGKKLFLNKVKRIIGLTMDKYGHVREGYTIDKLNNMLAEAKFIPQKIIYYSYLLTESIEMLLNRIYIMLNKNKVKKRNGVIAPTNVNEYREHKIAYAMFKLLYPLLWWGTRLDFLLKYFGAYAVIMEAKKT